MTKLTRFLLASALIVGLSTTAFSQTRTWVSGVGDDLNPCSRTAPCKTFAGAISKTAANGEISVLDPGGFGTITITKSISINGTGTLASILAAGTNGVNVNDSASGSPNTIVVILRDLSINGASTGFDGIRFTSGKSLTVDHCWIYGFNGNGANSDGIDVAKNADGHLRVINGATIENITGDGIRMTTTAGTVVAVVDNTSIMNCGQNGIEAITNVRGEITRSNVEILAANGIMTSGGNSQLNVDDTTVAHANTTGLRASAGSSIRVSDSMIANNSTGISANGGTVDSFQGNSLIGNPTPGSFSSTTQKQ
jgi:hypothetical protein